jgi:hypothetical protein
MTPRVPAAATVLSLAAYAGAAIASLATLVWDGAFPPPPDAPPHNGILAEARGWSVVTVSWALPLGALALDAARRGSARGRVAWAGVLAYLVYTYLELAVSGPFTPLFLVYVATLACASVALAAVLGGQAAPVAAFGPRAANRAVGVFALVVSIGLALAWTKGLALRMWQGDYGWPDAYGSVGQVVHALDLGLQVPLGLAAGVLLLRDRPAGVLVGGVQITMAATMFPALTGMVAASGIESGTGIAAAAPFAVGSCVAVALAAAFFGVRLPDRASAAPRRT